MKEETAISLIVVVMEALVHREVCTKVTESDFPSELLCTAFEVLESAGRNTLETRAWLSAHGVNLPPSNRQIYRRRANNQASETTESLIRNLLTKGWTKSSIASALRINRRVVIRVAREALSAQNSQE